MSSTPSAASLTALLSAAVRATVEVTLANGAAVHMRGVTVTEFIQTIRDFPKARAVLLRAVGMGEEIDVDRLMNDGMSALIDEVPEAMAALVARAMDIRDKAGVAAVLALSDEDQAKLFEKAIDLTMPSGVSDFFGRFKAVAAKLGLAGAGTPGGDEASAEAA